MSYGLLPWSFHGVGTFFFKLGNNKKKSICVCDDKKTCQCCSALKPSLEALVDAFHCKVVPVLLLLTTFWNLTALQTVFV